MNTYYVTRWGNDISGPDEEDASFIVVARNYKSAAELVDSMLTGQKPEVISNFCHRITELGSAHANSEKIILGPVVSRVLYHDDVGIPDNKKWVRDSLEEGWEEFSEYYED
ncbi:hypothetical protein [Pseudoteredinibacter isoporae]|uniref:Uncharacterized protein n=1 Tax=Pseudoteredinibacter isoporae TaxID=570281 RepID=A0A7X0JPQ5_9GAMM|nr:hypothetical protein [Pseudoteredinibacter isoporae]MBB6520014.1 hypothetical protein [Pseudoteredinibacter isoporae]NHO85586.1 hypothetical protein [Pseudoteredinibacter isoporae]NIB25962.1 hypothetical protein [Pseudoteredinibacter isoporae]